MVRYTGRRASQITANSTNQPGLKLSGSVSGIGSRFRNVGQRVTDNVKVCGPVYRHGVIWSFNTKNNSICVPPAPKCQSIAGGVGRINAPHFSCALPSEKLKREQAQQAQQAEEAAATAAQQAAAAAREKTRREYQAAYEIMKEYLLRVKPGFQFALVGKDPQSIGYYEGIVSNAPWAFKAWRSASPVDTRYINPFHPEELSWDWARDLIKNNDPEVVRLGITELGDFMSFAPNEPFALGYGNDDSFYNSAPDPVKRAIDKFNNLELRVYINKYYEATHNGDNGGLILHKVGIISDEDIVTLKRWGYGMKILDSIEVFGADLRFEILKKAYEEVKKVKLTTPLDLQRQQIKNLCEKVYGIEKVSLVNLIDIVTIFMEVLTIYDDGGEFVKYIWERLEDNDDTFSEEGETLSEMDSYKKLKTTLFEIIDAAYILKDTAAIPTTHEPWRILKAYFTLFNSEEDLTGALKELAVKTAETFSLEINNTIKKMVGSYEDEAKEGTDKVIECAFLIIKLAKDLPTDPKSALGAATRPFQTALVNLIRPGG